MKSESAGYPAPPMTLAHVAPLLEPLLFAPAFVAVGWALVSALRGTRPPQEDHHD